MRPYSGYSIRSGWLRRCWRSIGVTVVLIQSAVAQDINPCKLEPIGTAHVAAVRDARHLVLADGREVRLAGVETPDTDQAETARAALAALTLDRDVTLKRSGAAEDRYGRILAFVFPAEGQLSAQEILLAGGHARVSARVGERGCAALLLKQEAAARQGKQGLWAQEAAFPRQTDQADEIAAAQGRFPVLEGKVVSVRESRGVVYMNFGRRIARDFTVTILKRNERIFTAAGLEPKKLEGKRVRVRGWIEQRRGPIIEATRAEQIELAELN